MLVALEACNRERDAAGEPRLLMGIGLNYGPAVPWSEQILSLTVIGDTVNTASRLQGLTRASATPLVVPDAVVQAIHETANGDITGPLGKLRDRV